jgi:hypothetical protein
MCAGAGVGGRADGVLSGQEEALEAQDEGEDEGRNASAVLVWPACI